jgi:hypothetical protein
MRRCFASSNDAAQKAIQIRQMGFHGMSMREPDDKQSTDARELRPLDPIDPRLPFKLDLSKVTTVTRIAAQSGLKWAALLQSYLTDGYPRAEGLDPSSPGFPKSDPDSFVHGVAAEATLTALAQAGILKIVTDLHPVDRTWASLFQVPKNAEYDRAIVNCKGLNEGFKRPPSLVLAEISALIGLVKFFGDATLSVADIRHFFWQLKVALNDRKYFSFSSSAQGVFECIALAMGWSWSPWTAQGIAGLVVIDAVGRLQAAMREERKKDKKRKKSEEGEEEEVTLIAQPGGAVVEESPPPFWFIVEKSTRQVIAIVVIWYDNFLVISKRESKRTADTIDGMLRAALNAAMGDFKLQWKYAPGEKHAWTVKRNETEYIGIHFHRDDNNTFCWQHISSNIAGWEAVGVTLAPTMSVVQLSRVLGVITWDAHIRLGLRHPSEIRRLMSAVGVMNAKIVAGAAGRDATMDITSEELGVLRNVWMRLIENVDTIDNDENLQFTKCLASDATPDRGAGVILDGPVEHRHVIYINLSGVKRLHPVTGETVPADINVKETMMAALTVLEALEALPVVAHTLFVIAVDNTTGVSWFNGRTALDDDTQELLEAMDRALDKHQCKAWAVWEPTSTQPADEPTRLDEHGILLKVIEAKVIDCRRRLLEAVCIKKGELGVANFQKRERE